MMRCAKCGSTLGPADNWVSSRVLCPPCYEGEAQGREIAKPRVGTASH